MKSFKFLIYGPAAEPVTVKITPTEQATPESWLEEFASWIRSGDVHELPTPGGEARINFSRVWAVEYRNPPKPPPAPVRGR